MAIYGPKVRSVGSATRPLKANGAHIFKRDYFEHAGASGDVRGAYQDLNITSTGSGETLRVRGIASAAGVATAGTVNAIHATGRVASGGTVSGALNAVRATLEVAGTTPTPGGTLSAIQVDTNISTGWTQGGNDAFIRVSNSGEGKLTSLFNIEEAPATDTPTSLVSTHTDHASTHLIKIRVNGADMWLLATNAH